MGGTLSQVFMTAGRGGVGYCGHVSKSCIFPFTPVLLFWSEDNFRSTLRAQIYGIRQKKVSIDN